MSAYCALVSTSPRWPCAPPPIHGVFLDLVSNIVEHFKDGFAIDGSEVIFLEKVFLVIYIYQHDG